MTSPLLLAEGGYGCVHNPSLKCNSNFNITYDNKVSKILKHSDKNKELSEYKVISKIDKDKTFHLGKPETCLPDNSVSNIKAIEKCPVIGKKITENFKNYSLIIMKDGGLNLEQYGYKMNKLSVNSVNCNKVELFWLECHRLLLGIKELLKNHVVHNDLKAQNIVYNESNNRANFIDFGLMHNIKKEKRKCRQNKIYEFNHWSYPYESCILSKETYISIQKMEPEKIRKYSKDFMEDSATWYYSYRTNLSDKDKSDSFTEYLQFIYFDIKKMDYETFINNYYETTDIYGLGIGFITILDYTQEFISNTLASKLHDLFLKMTSTNPVKRIHIDDLLQSYEILMKDIANKHNIRFVDNMAVKLSSRELNFKDQIQDIVRDKKIPNSHLSREELDIVYNKDPDNSFLCPEGKFFNIATKRCNKIIVRKERSTGKSRNTLTNRCITKKNYRKPNSKYRFELLKKPCANGKFRNHHTARCKKIV